MNKGAAGEQGGGPFDELLQDILCLPAMDIAGQRKGRYIEVNDIVALIARHSNRKRLSKHYGAIIALSGLMPEILNCKVEGNSAVLSKTGVIDAIAQKVGALSQLEQV